MLWKSTATLVARTGLLCFLAVLPSALGEAADRGRRNSIWQSDFDKAQQEAQRLGLPMLVHFYADWCGPCKKMDAEVLGSAALELQLGERAIAVKINSDKNLELCEKYEVQSLPTDLFLEPGGRIIGRYEGYQSPQDYLARVSRADARWTQARKQQIAGSTRIREGDVPDGPQLGGASNPGPDGGSRNASGARDKPPVSENGSPIPGTHPSSPQGDASNRMVGLDGFSPVMLALERKWVKGDPRHTAEFKGVTYWFRDSDEVAAFNEHPQRFAPRLLGCDPVMLWKTDRAFPGSTQYGAFYAGELYLFVSAASREEFKQHPERYIRSRHVLRPDLIERGGIRRAAAEPAHAAG
mgnify:CR=1 FL=1